jgi:hypothetical protein
MYTVLRAYFVYVIRGLNEITHRKLLKAIYNLKTLCVCAYIRRSNYSYACMLCITHLVSEEAHTCHRQIELLQCS